MVDFLDEDQVVFKSPILLDQVLEESNIHHIRKNLYFLSTDELNDISESQTKPLNFQILRVDNDFEYNSIHIPLSAHHYIQSIVKVGVQEEGSYHFSIM